MGSTPCLLYTILCVVFEARVINLCDRDIATDTWAKVDFKRICNNKEQALFNLSHIQEGLVGGTKTITQGLGEED